MNRVTLDLRTKAAFVVAIFVAFAGPATASHVYEHESGWFEVHWDETDTEIRRCNALGAVELDQGLWLHDRPGSTVGFGLGSSGSSIVDENGGGTFIYMETNEIDGIQIGGENGRVKDPYAYMCPNPDALIFGHVQRGADAIGNLGGPCGYSAGAGTVVCTFTCVPGDLILVSMLGAGSVEGRCGDQRSECIATMSTEGQTGTPGACSDQSPGRTTIGGTGVCTVTGVWLTSTGCRGSSWPES